MPDIGVETPDGGIAYFPEGTHPDKIRDALRAKFGGGPATQVAKSFGQKLSEFWEETPVSMSPLGIAKGIVKGVQAFPKTLEASLPSALNDPNAVGDPQRIAAQTDIAALALGRPSAPQEAVKAVIPTREEIRAQFKAGYKALEESGARIRKESVDALGDSIKSRLEKEGDRDFNQPSTFKNISRLGEIKDDASIFDIDAIRKALGKVMQDNPGKSEAASARKAIGMIDDFLGNISETEITGSGAKEAVKLLKDTQKEVGVEARSSLIEKQMGKAGRQAAKTYSGGNIENTIRQKIGTIVEGIKDGKLKGYSPEEIAALEKVVEGNFIRNSLRKLGKLSPTGVIPGLAELAAFVHGDMGLAAALAGTGLLSKKSAEFLAKKAAQDADKLVRSRSSLAKPGTPADKAEYLRRGLAPAFGYTTLVPGNQ